MFCIHFRSACQRKVQNTEFHQNLTLSLKFTERCSNCISRIWRFSWTNKSTYITLLTIVNIVYFYMYVYSFLGRAWGIDWLMCHKSMKYTCVIQFKLYLPMQDPHDIIRTAFKYIIIKYLFRIWRRRKKTTYNITKNANFKSRWNILCAKV
jgi:hypothetical protein